MSWERIAEIAIGSLPIGLTILLWLFHIDRQLTLFIVEHHMLLTDYCKRMGLKMEELPTRVRRR